MPPVNTPARSAGEDTRRQQSSSSAQISEKATSHGASTSTGSRQSPLAPAPPDGEPASTAHVSPANQPRSDASSATPGSPPSPTKQQHPTAHTRRSTVNGDALITDDINLDSWKERSPQPPDFIRGWLKEYYLTKAFLHDRVSHIVKAEDTGMVDLYGFQRGETGAAQAAIDGLVADLLGRGGANVKADDLVRDLHAKTFQNYNRWAKMVGATVVGDPKGHHGSSSTDSSASDDAGGDRTKRNKSGKTGPGKDEDTRTSGEKWFACEALLADLALYYCIKAEAANMRFMPELMCWLFHQMRFKRDTVSRAELENDRVDIESSHFYRTTVAPLYQMVKVATKREIDTRGTLQAVMCCCVKQGKKRALPNSERINYDDINETFWRPEVLQCSYHNRDTAHGLTTLPPFVKTFREKSSYLSVFLSLWRWFVFLAVTFHALYVVATMIVNAGGNNLAGIILIDPFDTIVNLTACFQTQAMCHFIRVMIMLAHERCTRAGSPVSRYHCKENTLLFKQVAWGALWAVAMMALGFSKALLGTQLFGGPIWFIVIGVRLVFMAISEGICSLCGCTRDTKIRRFFTDLEGYNLATPSHVVRGVLGWTYMRQPVSRVIKYSLFWLPLILAKVVLDLQILTQQVNLIRTVHTADLSYQWNFSLLGYNHAIISIGSWPSIVVLFLLDSYIAFTLGAAVIGYCTLRGDGVGRFRAGHDLKQSFLHGLGRFRRTPLAAQFVQKVVPFAKKCGVEANQIFRRPWDQFVMSLRECDLISNEEQCRLMYGDAVLGVSNQMPLFLYAGKVKDFIMRASRVAQLAHSCSTDDEFRMAVFADTATEEAVIEIVLALPHILTLICQSHTAIGYNDPHIHETLKAAFAPRPGQSIREAVAAILTSEGQPRETLRTVAGMVAKLMVEFEKDSANTRLRGSPLVDATVALLTLLHQVWNPNGPDIWEEPVMDVQDLQGAQHGSGLASFPAPALDRLAALAGHSRSASRMGSQHTSTHHGLRPISAMDTRSIAGIVRLMQLPNEGSGRLDGDDDEYIRERLECLRESARRVFYLITMHSADASLKCPEAERRLLFFISSLYMDQMPAMSSILHMPSFAVLTPQYNEAVMYTKSGFLTAVNRHGVSPMVYLKSIHPEEWAYFCERIGVKNERDAWHAEQDAQGNSISGELEVRLWASHRGQTLARTIHGVMEYARAIRLLAVIQLELEYSVENDALPLEQRRAPVEIESDAIKAAQWFTAEKFRYICACQKYADHGEDDLKRRSDIDFMMMTHPLLNVVYFENSISAITAKRRLMTVCRNGSGMQYRIPCPGNPIADGIGEGKPENQMNAQPFLHGRVVQALDMNQDGYFEEALKIGNALAVLRQKPTSGRPLVVVGLREHVFTHALSASAFFMSQQEYLFGTMWQRVMASPLRVRMHYGHPDLFDKVFMATRGGTAKASVVVNVSEDIFAGFTAALRGGESEHIEFMQMGKGRDVGMLQIEVFESKISGGTAMSMTARDSFRLLEAMDFSRLMSFYHSCGGFYISNVLIVISFVCTLYYMAAMAMTGLDEAVLASEKVFLVGEINALQWFVQMGLLSVLPLGVLYAQGYGLFSSLWRLIKMTLTMGPIFFMFEIQTKAYYYDAALCFGKQCYMGTGRDFVIRHLSFDETFRSTAHSHLYLGMEAFLLLVFITSFGTFQSSTTYMFFFFSGWLFTVSLLLGAFWFNPFALELRFVKTDISDWWAWMVRGEGTPDQCWTSWYEREAGNQYSQANIGARIWRSLRVTRLLFIAALVLLRVPAAQAAPALYMLMYVGLGAAGVLAMQVAHIFAAPCPRMPVDRRGRGMCASLPAAIIKCSTYLLLLGGSAILPYLGTVPAAGGTDALLGYVTFSITFWWASRLLNISSCWPLAAGIRAAHQIGDFQVGIVVLAIQLGCAIGIPLGSVLHTNLLFSADYADTVEVITGARDVLNKHSRNAGTKFLKIKHLGELEFKRARAVKSDGPENKIGIRRRWLRRLSQIGNTPTADKARDADQEGHAPGDGDIPGAGTSLDGDRDPGQDTEATHPERRGHKTLRSIMAEFQMVGVRRPPQVPPAPHDSTAAQAMAMRRGGAPVPAEPPLSARNKVAIDAGRPALVRDTAAGIGHVQLPKPEAGGNELAARLAAKRAAIDNAA